MHTWEWAAFGIFWPILNVLQNWIKHITQMSNLKLYGYKPILGWFSLYFKLFKHKKIVASCYALATSKHFNVKMTVTLNRNICKIRYSVILFNHGLLCRSVFGYMDPCQVILNEDRKWYWMSSRGQYQLSVSSLDIT